MTAAPPLIEAHCSVCQKTRKTKLTPKNEPRTPTGWKRHNEQTYCEDCWSQRYVLRAVSMPVAEPLGCTWEELRGDLKLMWRLVTQASNWMMTELYVRDVRRGSEEKMPPMVRQYFYPEIGARWPELPPQTRAALEQSVTKKYRALRYAIVWTAAQALPAFRYPVPYPVPNQGWSARIENDRPIVRIATGVKKPRELRLKTGSQFRRQLTAFRQIARGEAVQGEAAIYQQGKKLMVKMVAWLPREGREKPLLESVLRVSTQKDSLLVAVNVKDEKLWNYHGDHLRRWSAEHRKQLQRWADDSKYENRPVPSFADRRAAAAQKYRNRMNSATHEIAAQLAGYAARRRFTKVVYDDNVREFCEGFTWFRLRNLMKEKLDAKGVAFESSGPPEPENPKPLAEGEVE